MFFTVHPLILQQVFVRGSRFGPAAMRHESFGLETYSPYQDRDLMDIRVFDSGDLELVLEAVKWHFQILKREQKRY